MSWPGKRSANVGRSKVFIDCYSSFGNQRWVRHAGVIYTKLSDLLERTLGQSVSLKMVKIYSSPPDLSKKSGMQLWRKALTFRNCKFKFVKRLVIQRNVWYSSFSANCLEYWWFEIPITGTFDHLQIKIWFFVQGFWNVLRSGQ